MRDSRLYTAYRRDMDTHVYQYSREEQEELARNGEDGMLVQSLLPFVHAIVSRLMRDRKAYGAEFEDMIQAGNIGLMQAVKSWNPDAEPHVALTTWCEPSIRREILREGRRQELVTPAQDTTHSYAGLEGSAPSPEFDDMETDDYAAYLLDALDTGDTPNAAEDVEPSPEDTLLSEELWDTIKSMDPDDTCILSLVFKRDHNQSDLAKLWGISRQAVHQRLAVSLKNLRRILDTTG